MSRKKNMVTNLHYYSAHLKQKLNIFPASSAVIVEAPVGYGKTTAVHDYLKAAVSQKTEVYWVTAVDEAPAAIYRRFCREIEKIDARAGERLLKIDFPNVFTIGEACDALRAIECKCETWLVIDNFQFLCASLPASFLVALIEHGSSNLHVVIITQMLGRDCHNALTGRKFLHIQSSDLRLEANDIHRYYALSGVNLTETEAEKVLTYTEGWIIAVYLQLCAFRETGSFSDTAIFQLMERLVWDKLTGEQQTFLLRLSPFETITVRQMCSLLGCVALPDYAQDCLSISFIRYDETQRRYEPHSTLFKLMAQLRSERGAAFERECLKQAGDLCRDEGEILEALKFYVQINEYERILSLDFSPLIFQEIGNTTFFEIALKIVQNCPAEIKREYPLSMLRVAWALKAASIDAVFGALLDELDELLEEDGLLRAEWLLLSAYRHYPHLDKMLPDVQKAALMFGSASSRVILPEAPWAFGQYSQLSAFHLKPGEADLEADALETFIAVYSKLTNGHGSGADALMRAEIAYLRGDFSNTEIYAYKTVFLAENSRQSIIHFGAAKLLVGSALWKADTEGWQHAANSMECAVSYANQNTTVIRLTLDTLRGNILTELWQPARIADWLKNGDFSNSMLLAPMVGNAFYVHMVYLLQVGEYSRFIGIQEAIPPELINKNAFAAFLFPLFLSAGYINIDREKAAGYLASAAEKALPDGFILPLASSSLILQGLVEELFEKNHPQFLDKFNAMKETFGFGWGTLHNEMFAEKLPPDLTARELEIAQLASKGLRNSEIAQRLFVAESTVRAHLRTIFQKLNIDRRAKLAEKLK